MVVLLCHGLPGARVQIPSVEILDRTNVRVIIIERPGIGRSHPHPVRTIADWSADASAVLAAADVDQVTLVGYSAGTPYALSFASQYPERVTKIYVISGMAPSAAADIAKLSPMNRWLHSLGNTLPPAARRTVAWAAARFIGTGAKAGDFGIKIMRNTFTAAENRYIDTPDGAVFRAMLAENFRQGYDGYLVDLGLVTKHWPITYERIQHPIYAWYGSDDRITPPTAATSLCAFLPQTAVTITPGAGHLLIFMAWDELVSRIANEA
jgi:pimeloyl-ACP methyl ester carboxylesterase